MRAPAFWSENEPGVIARWLRPLGELYGAATGRRMAQPGERVGVPVICVGNFVVGGAGKTPTALSLARLLLAAGERAAFLSRGYGGERRAAPLRVDPLVHGARSVGDEPLLLARVAPCFVGADRVAAANAAIEAGASVLIMDDGLQNPSLAKDLSFAVVDGEAGFGNGLCLPAGPLRAPLEAQARFVDALVVIGGEGAPAFDGVAPGRPRFRARLQPDAVAAAQLVGRPAFAFAGIARPEKFFASLEAIGARVAARRAFADHHRFSRHEIDRLILEAEIRGLIPVTTEKDRMRIAADQMTAIRTLPVTLGFEDPRGLAALLTRALAARRRRAAI